MNDGGGLANLAYQAKLESLRAQGKNMFVSGYFQYYHGFSYANDAVCWAMRPDREAQEAVSELHGKQTRSLSLSLSLTLNPTSWTIIGVATVHTA